jgi:hypothetical protein
MLDCSADNTSSSLYSGQYTLGGEEVELPSGEPAWLRLVWSGIAVGPDKKGVISVSSPLLLRAMMVAATDTESLPDLPPLPDELTSRSEMGWTNVL